MSELSNEYKSEAIKQAIHHLEEDGGFTHFRGMRGDGNCYYRSVAFAYIEKIVLKKNVNALLDLIEW